MRHDGCLKGTSADGKEIQISTDFPTSASCCLARWFQFPPCRFCTKKEDNKNKTQRQQKEQKYLWRFMCRDRFAFPSACTCSALVLLCLTETMKLLLGVGIWSLRSVSPDGATGRENIRNGEIIFQWEISGAKVSENEMASWRRRELQLNQLKCRGQFSQCCVCFSNMRHFSISFYFFLFQVSVSLSGRSVKKYFGEIHGKQSAVVQRTKWHGQNSGWSAAVWQTFRKAKTSSRLSQNINRCPVTTAKRTKDHPVVTDEMCICGRQQMDSKHFWQQFTDDEGYLECKY